MQLKHPKNYNNIPGFNNELTPDKIVLKGTRDCNRNVNKVNVDLMMIKKFSQDCWLILFEVNGPTNNTIITTNVKMSGSWI